MNVESLQQRIAEISTNMSTLSQQYTALQSHLNEANFWLNKLLAPAESIVNDVVEAIEHVAEAVVDAVVGESTEESADAQPEEYPPE